jgi:hypothetical protein
LGYSGARPRCQGCRHHALAAGKLSQLWCRERK